jgi:hypothetical protein
MKYITNLEIDNLSKTGLEWIKNIFIDSNTRKYKPTTDIVEGLWGNLTDFLDEKWLVDNLHTNYIEASYHEVHRVTPQTFTLNLELKSSYAPIGLLNKLTKNLIKNNKLDDGVVDDIPVLVFGRSYEENYIPNAPLLNFILDGVKTFFVRKHEINTFWNDMGLSLFNHNDGRGDRLYWKDGEPNDEDKIKIDDYLTWAQERDLVLFFSKNEN